MDFLRPRHYNITVQDEDEGVQALPPPSGYSSPGYLNNSPGYLMKGNYSSPGYLLRGDLARHPTVKIFCRANPNYSLSIRDGSVVLAPTDPKDQYQHWIKDMRYSTKVQDEEGYPAFALVNKATGEAIKHSFGQSHPVGLVPYNPDCLDESVLWTESRDVGRGFRCIRMVNNIYLNFDAFHGDKDHGGVRDGTTVVLWKWCKGDNQSWKIAPYCELILFPNLLISIHIFWSSSKIRLYRYKKKKAKVLFVLQYCC